VHGCSVVEGAFCVQVLEAVRRFSHGGAVHPSHLWSAAVVSVAAFCIALTRGPNAAYLHRFWIPNQRNAGEKVLADDDKVREVYQLALVQVRLFPCVCDEY
jgi:hypothetical protein